MQVLRLETKPPAVCFPLEAAVSTESRAASASASAAAADASSVWSRLLQHFAAPAPVANRFLEVLMVVTKDKTWFLCADHIREAGEWADTICSAIERVSAGPQEKQTRRRLPNNASAVTLRELQARDAKARVAEFLEVFVRSTREDMCLQAAKGALAWSCMRSLAWKVWLGYLPSDMPFHQWTAIAREKRQRYEAARFQHGSIFQDLLTGKQRHEAFLTACETTEDTLLYGIYKDVRRTRGDMPHFREPHVQCLLIRVLYVYSVTHPEVSYNQGMSELLATLVYLLYIEQWPLEDDELEQVVAEDGDVAMDGRLSGSYYFPAPAVSPGKGQTDEDDASYVYIESFVAMEDEDDSYLDRESFLRLVPFSGGSGKYYECCRDAAEEIVRDLTAAEYVEHDAYLLLEEMMLRMAGAYCPQAPRRHPKPQAETPLSSADQLPPSPLDDQMNRIHHHILSRCDPPTARHLARLGAEPELFLLRWVRVLMAREFETPQVWQIWDAIFSLTPRDFSFINLLCVAVVRDFREEILAAEDATTVLLGLRDIADRLDPARLVDNARELYDALLLAAAVEASMGST
ncbi:hypothetical protein BBJ28_00000363 [Nothophytophthora sp. Chile5]|nr:hypothetical protein BBJ28_00000363 [Nothophytophthora sp. Chile5]